MSVIDDDRVDFLKSTTAREQQSNSEIIAKLTGTAVTYGSVITLQHVKTGRFLSASSRNLSRLEGDCLLAQVSEGGEASWWRVNPRYKIRSEGEEVLNGDEVRLFGVKLRQQLHVSKDSFPPGAVVRAVSTTDDSKLMAKEVNCSTELSSNIRLRVFTAAQQPQQLGQQLDKAQAQAVLSYGAIVALEHAETDQYLGVPSFKLSNMPTLTEKVRASNLFQVEGVDPFSGGNLEWGGKMRLRHVLTGLYLGIPRKSGGYASLVPRAIPEHTSTLSLVRTTTSGDDADASGKVRGADSSSPGEQGDQIVFGSSCTLYFPKGSKPNLHVGPVQDLGDQPADPAAPDLAIATPRLKKRLESATYCCYGAERPRQVDAFRLVPVDDELLASVTYLWSLAPTLRRMGRDYERLARASGKKKAGSDSDSSSSSSSSSSKKANNKSSIKKKPSLASKRTSDTTLTLTATDLTAFQVRCLALLTSFSRFLIGNGDIDVEPLTGSAPTPVDLFTRLTAAPRGLRQEVAKEFDVDAEVITILRGATQGVQLTGLSQANPRVFRLVRTCYYALSKMTQGNTENARPMEPLMPLFTEHLGTGVLAEEFITTMLKGNEELLKTIVDDKLIKLFLRLLRRQNMDARFLNFLSSMCVCDGKAMYMNQINICRIILDPSQKDLLVSVVIDPSTQQPCFVWQAKREFRVPLGQIKDAPEHAWVLPYFLEEVNLFGQLCLGRNSEVMDRLARSFPFDVLIAIVRSKSPDISSVLKSRLLDLILHLHVIRANVLEVDTPRMVRVLSDESTALPGPINVEGDDGPFRPPSAPSSASGGFAAHVSGLISFVNEHISGLPAAIDPDNHASNVLTASALVMILNLMRLGYFSTTASLSALFPRLLALLDPRSDPDFEQAGSGADHAVVEAMTHVKATILQIFAFAANLRLDHRVTMFLQVVRQGQLKRAIHAPSGLRFLGKGLSLATGAVALLNPFSKRNQVGPAPEAGGAETPEERALVTAREACEGFFLSEFERVKPELDLGKIQQDLPDMMVELLRRYELSESMRASLGLIDAEMQQLKVFQETLTEVQVLASDGLVKLHAELAPAVLRLRVLVQSGALWATPALCASNAPLMEAVLAEVIRISHLPSFTEISLGTRKVDPEVQRLLVNLKANVACMTFLDTVTFVPALKRSFDLALTLVGLMCYGTSTIQELLFRELDALLDLSDQGVHISHVLSAIFHENISLVSRVPPTEIKKFVEVIETEHCKPDSLGVLKSLVGVKGQVIRKNQSVVISSLLAHKDRVLNLFSTASERAARNKILARGPEGVDSAEISYYLNLLDLLANCCKGLNYLAETMCQPLVPFDGIIEDLANPSIPARVRRSLAYYLDEVFMDTETKLGFVVEDPNLPLAIAALAREAATLISQAAAQNPGARMVDEVRTSEQWLFVMDGIVPLISTYFRWTFSATPPELECKNGANVHAVIVEALDVFEVLGKRLSAFLTTKEAAGLEELAASCREARALIAASGGGAVVDYGAGAPRRQMLAAKKGGGGGGGAGGDDDTRDDGAMEEDKVKALKSSSSNGKKKAGKGAGGGVKFSDEDADEEKTRHALLAGGSGPGGSGGGLPAAEDTAGLMTFFQDCVKDSDDVNAAADVELVPLALKLLDDPDSCLALLKRLVADANSDQGPSLIRPHPSSVTLLRICQRMALCHDDTEKTAACQQLLDQAGLTEMVVNRIASNTKSKGRDERFLQALYLTGYALCKGGDSTVQNHLHALLTTLDSRLNFFDAVVEELNFAVAALKLYRKVVSTPSGLSALGSSAVSGALHHCEVVLLFLQLSCEGHHTDMQNLLREHEGSTSVLEAVSAVWLQATKTVYPVVASLARQCASTLIEFVQGPCLGNQEVLANGKFLDAANVILRRRLLTVPLSEATALKKLVFTLLQGLLEGRTDKVIHESLVNSLDIKGLCKIMFRPPLDKANDTNLDRRTEDVFALGFEAYMLLSTLGDYSATVRATFLKYGQDNPAAAGSGGLMGAASAALAVINPLKMLGAGKALLGMAKGGPKDYDTHHDMYSNQVAHIEVIVKGNLYKVFFRKPAISRYLTASTKRSIVWGINRESPHDKLTDFIARTDDVVEDMKHQKALASNPLFGYLANHSEDFLDLSLLAAIVINLIFIVSFAATTDGLDDNLGSSIFLPDALDKACRGIGWIQTICNLVVTVLYAARMSRTISWKRWSHYEVLRKKRLQAKARDTPWSPQPEIKDRSPWLNLPLFLYCIVEAHAMDKQFLYYGTALVFSFLGNFVSLAFFAFHLLGVIPRVETLKNVIRAITHKASQLAATMLLGLIVLYLWSVWSFVLYRRFWRLDGREPQCDNLRSCLGVVINFGLRAGGGIGDVMNPADPSDTWFGGRVVADVFFFLMVNVVLLNVIFGIIVDTFADLRESEKAALLDMHSRCDICNIERTTFEEHGLDLEDHSNKDHSMWNYCFYKAYLAEKDESDYTGLESEVARMVRLSSVEWLPLYRSLAVDAAVKGAEVEVVEETEDHKRLVELASKLQEQAESVSTLKGEFKRLMKEVIRISVKVGATASIADHHHDDDEPDGRRSKSPSKMGKK
jgi:hypothetical protein